jgi:uncharacterized protein YacL
MAEKESNKKKVKKTAKVKKEKKSTHEGDGRGLAVPELPAKLVQALADEVAKTVASRFPTIPRRSSGKKKQKKVDDAIFLDTSAIIDGRVFDVINLGVLTGTVIIPESILLELKHIADSQDLVKRERGRKGLDLLDKLKKAKSIKVVHLPEKETEVSPREVDDKLIEVARSNKGRLITCDYNLEKKASISGVTAININSLANLLKIKAVPGEALHIKVLHVGKDTTQGVGYLDDGTMLVVEHASGEVGREIDVIVSRVIQTSAGRILFSKKI